MFEYKEDHLMGPKSDADCGENPGFFCSAYGAADDQLAELARLVGSDALGDDGEADPVPNLKKASGNPPIQMVDDAPALEFDLEGELTRAFSNPIPTPREDVSVFGTPRLTPQDFAALPSEPVRDAFFPPVVESDPVDDVAADMDATSEEIEQTSFPADVEAVLEAQPEFEELHDDESDVAAATVQNDVAEEDLLEEVMTEEVVTEDSETEELAMANFELPVFEPEETPVASEEAASSPVEEEVAAYDDGAVEAKTHVSTDEMEDAFDDDLLGEELERALADEFAMEDDPVAEPVWHEQRSQTVSPLSRGPQMDMEPLAQPAPEPAPKRSLATPVAAPPIPPAPAVASAASQPVDDFKAELARLLGQDPAQVSSSKSAPPLPSEMLDPWKDPQIVNGPAVPPGFDFDDPAAKPASFQPPQMRDFDSYASDYSQHAGDLADFLSEQAKTERTPAAPVFPSEPAPVPAPMPAPKIEASMDVQPVVAQASPSAPNRTETSLFPELAGIAVSGSGLAAAGAGLVARRGPEEPQARDAEPVKADFGNSPTKPAQVPADPYNDPTDDLSEELQAELDTAYFDENLAIPDAAMPVDIEEKRKTGRRAAFALVALALLGGLGVLGFNQLGGEDGPAPTILASTDPIKVKPEDAGGKVVPNQDQAVYQSVDGGDAAEPKQDRLTDNSETPLEVATGVDDKAAERAPETSSETTGGLILKPRRVRTVVVKPDGTIVSTNGDTAAVAPESGLEIPKPVLSLRPEAVEETTATPNTVRTVTYNAPKADGDAAQAKPVEIAKVEPEEAAPAASQAAAPAQPETQAAIQPEAEAKPEAAPAQEPEKEATDSLRGGLPSVDSPYAVQVSSQRSAEAAQKTYANLSRRYGNIIGGKGVDIRKAVIKGKDYYRVRIPAQSRDEANALCGKLKSSGGDCFVTR